ncbi:hypothetical protein FJZ53_01180 [Candidatus Woesearchaeota archaeon]|nr:hypothetical protein [Candidatus Woesearchaeota archaeon]
MNDRVKRIKTAKETLEYLIDDAKTMIGASGATTGGHYVTTVKDAWNGRKKGFYARDASVIDKEGTIGFSRGSVLEYVEYFNHGEVENFALKMVMGHMSLPHGFVSRDEMAKHTSIEAWMTMTDKTVMYGKYGMDNIEQALNYKTDNKLEQRFVKELNECIVKAVKKGRQEIYDRLFGK